MSSGQANIIENLPNHKVEDDFSTLFVKDINIGDLIRSKQNILQKLAFIETFEKMAQWVKINSGGLKFVANPNSAGDEDRSGCLLAIQEPITLALKAIKKRRKNGRDKRLIAAAQVSNYYIIADILASTAMTYWRDHGFFAENKAREKKVIASQLQNEEKNQQKKDFQKVQLEYIGAAVDFKKALKKGAFQETIDFDETELIILNINWED